jgi:1-acyl-sn-glycerol-3-phosphate acyltransferase
LKKIVTLFRSLAILFWVVISTIFYGTACLLARIFGEAGSWAISVFWCRSLLAVAGVKVEIDGLQRLDPKKNYVFLANHQSYMDIMALYFRLPYKISFMAKRSLFYIPFFGWCMGAIGHIPLDRGNPHKARKSLDNAVSQLQSKHRSIFAFPEGTRSKTGDMAEFKLGIFNLAMQAGIDIVPVVIEGARDVWPKYSLLIRPGRITLETLEPISIADYRKSDKFTLARTVHDRIETRLKERSAGAK